MAVIIRHGPAGSYKSSYAVWFELLPALREGRIVVTNVEGMKSLEEIEKRLGERLPISARLFRISSQTEKGKRLWQHWYNWVPLGAFVLIDEAQDIFTKTQGFNIQKNIYMGVEQFSGDLPHDYIAFYNDVRSRFKPEEVYVDDIGERVIDDNGNVVMPADFSESFQRHRKYNWDIVLCTPNIKALGDEVKSVSEIAVAHKSRDGLGFKRRTRLFEHDPRSTSIKPSKDDSVEIKKVPVAVHLLYASTSTGQTTKAGVTSSIFKSVRLWLALAAFAYGIYSMVSGYYDNVSNTDSVSNQQASNADASQVETNSETASVVTEENTSDGVVGASSGSGVGNRNNRDAFSNARDSLHHLDKPAVPWPYEFASLYVSGVHLRYTNRRADTTVLFESVGVNGKSQYLQSDILEKLGYEFVVLDQCLVMVNFRNVSQFVACRGQLDLPDYRPKPERQLAEQVQEEVIDGIPMFGGSV